MSSYRSYYNLLEMALNLISHLQNQPPSLPTDYNPHIRTNTHLGHSPNLPPAQSPTDAWEPCGHPCDEYMGLGPELANCECVRRNREMEV